MFSRHVNLTDARTRTLTAEMRERVDYALHSDRDTFEKQNARTLAYADALARELSEMDGVVWEVVARDRSGHVPVTYHVACDQRDALLCVRMDRGGTLEAFAVPACFGVHVANDADSKWRGDKRKFNATRWAKRILTGLPAYEQRVRDEMVAQRVVIERAKRENDTFLALGFQQGGNRWRSPTFAPGVWADLSNVSSDRDTGEVRGQLTINAPAHLLAKIVEILK